MTMRIERYEDPQAFLRDAMELLLRNEAANNLIIGLAERLRYPTEALLCTVRDGQAVVAAALMTSPRPLVLSDAPADAIDALERELTNQVVAVSGVIATSPTADAFADRWCKCHHLQHHLHLALGVHELDRVMFPEKAPGTFRVATMQDLDVTGRWIDAFAAEIHEPIAEDGLTKARAAIEQGRIFFWESDGQPVSMAGWNRRLVNGIAIGLVYTPPDQRGRGYASNCVAALSQQLLDSGWKFCCLFTDLANPTSNKIYRNIGYRMIAENKHIRFEPT